MISQLQRFQDSATDSSACLVFRGMYPRTRSRRAFVSPRRPYHLRDWCVNWCLRSIYWCDLLVRLVGSGRRGRARHHERNSVLQFLT
jgi:hypothetical protein